MVLLVGEIAVLLKILAGVAGRSVAATNSALVVGRNADWDETEAAFSMGAVKGVIVVTMAADGVADAGVIGNVADEQLTPAPAKTFVFVEENFVSEGKLDERVTSSGELTLSLERALPLIDNEDKDVEGDATRDDER